MHRTVALPLWLLLPLVWYGGLYLARRAVADRRLAAILSPGFALALWLVPLQLIGIWTHSFYFALYASAVLAAAVGVYGWFHPEAEMVDSGPWSGWLWVGGILAMAFILPLEMLWTEHDEWTTTSHTSIPHQIQLGYYPPHHMLFGQFELKYHYGFDLCSSIFSLLFGQLDMWWSVHLVTVLLWGYAFCLFWAMGERWIGGRMAGPIAGACVLLAGGMPYTCRSLEPLGSFMTGDCSTIGMWCLPPLVSNFVQHPWSLGIPLSACATLVFHERRLKSGAWFLGLALVMGLLSLAQVVAFGALLASFVVAGAFSAERSDWRISRWGFSGWNLAKLVGLAIVVTLLARLMHGFFAPTAEPPGLKLVYHPFWLDPLLDWAAYHWISFGFMLPLGLLGLYWLKGERLLFGLLLLGSFLMFNFFRYPHSWDIVKFFMFAEAFTGFLSAAAIVHLWRTPWLRPVAALGLISVTVFACTWMIGMGLGLPGIGFLRSLPPLPSKADQAAIRYLERWIKAGESVYRTDRPETYALFGGLPEMNTPWDPGADSFGFSRAVLQHRKRVQSPQASREDFLAEGVRWFVVSPSDGEIQKKLDSWADEGLAQREAEFPPLKLYYLEGNK